MLKTRIIPSLDVKDSRIIKGVHFVDLIDVGDPLESARTYDGIINVPQAAALVKG